MYRDYKPYSIIRWGTIALMGLPLMAESAWAAEAIGGWRATYDEIMRWVNFAIFTLVIVKFARKPLADFLKGRQKEVAEEIEAVEFRKKRAETEVQAMMDLLNQSSLRLEKIKTRIVTQGEKRKAKLIAEAKSESDTLLNASRVKIKGQVAQARDRLKSEMIDKAFDLALQRLPEELTPADNARIVNEYLTEAIPK